MRHGRISSWLGFAAAFACTAHVGTATAQQPPQPQPQQVKVRGAGADFAVNKEVLVLYVDGQAAAASAAAQAAGLTVVEDYKPGRFLRCVPGARVRSNAEAAARVAAAPSVRQVEPNYTVSIPTPPVPARPSARAVAAPRKSESAKDANPNDPRFTGGDLWGMHSIRGPAAWGTIHDAREEVVVAVIDTGIDYTHEDLKQNMWTNRDEVPGDGKDNDGNGIVDDVYGARFTGTATGTGDPKDDHGHGTHCAGTIGALGNNALGVVGVNWNVKIMAVKFLRADGSGTTNDAVKCIDYAIGKGAKVMSNSWGGGGPSQALADAIGRAEQAGILFVAAAGNSASDNDSNPEYPASYDNANIVSVLAVDPQDARSWFSCYGSKTVDVGAPGGAGNGNGDPKTEILSTTPGNKYDAWAGTSMATPHVAGAAALAWSLPQNNGKTPLEIKELLLTHARKVEALTGKCVSGGTLDLSFLGNGSPTPPPPPDASFVVGNSTELALGGAFVLTGQTGRADYSLNGAHYGTKLHLVGQATSSDGFKGWVYREEYDPAEAFDFLFTEQPIGNVLYHRVYVRMAADDPQTFEYWFADTTTGTPPGAANESKSKALRNVFRARGK